MASDAAVTSILIVPEQGSVAAERPWLATLSGALGEPLEALGGVYAGGVSSRLHLYPPPRRKAVRRPLCLTPAPGVLGEFPHDFACRSCHRIASCRVDAAARLDRRGGWGDPVVRALRSFARQRPTLTATTMEAHLLVFDALIELADNRGPTYHPAAYLRREAPSRLHAFRELPGRPPIALCSWAAASGSLCRTPHAGACMNCAIRIGPHPQRRPHGEPPRELRGLVTRAAAGALERGVDHAEVAALLRITPDTLRRRIRSG